MTISSAQLEQLIQSAIRARTMAYAPYSRFQVGAAVLGSNLQIYGGCNVENASYGLTICAERNAVFSMVAAGCCQLIAVALALPGGGTPCGACRQVLAEFGQDFQVYLVDSTSEQLIAEWNSEKLLPDAFRLHSRGHLEISAEDQPSD
jgi:cytidine deaminase